MPLGLILIVLPLYAPRSLPHGWDLCASVSICIILWYVLGVKSVASLVCAIQYDGSSVLLKLALLWSPCVSSALYLTLSVTLSFIPVLAPRSAGPMTVGLYLHVRYLTRSLILCFDRQTTQQGYNRVADWARWGNRKV